MPGYERNRIDGVPDHDLDEFTCAICLGIFNNPVSTQCCRHTFCKDCIREWVSLHKSCPNDRKTLTKRGLKPVPRVLVNLLENMKIKCSFEADGCQQVVKLGELEQHLTVCDYRPNQLCKTCGLIKESVLSHNCIQSLITEKERTDEKYINLLDENSSLMLLGREKDDLIGKLRHELAQLKINHQRSVDQLKEDQLKDLRDIKLSYGMAYENLRDHHATEMDRIKSINYKLNIRVSDLKWELKDRDERLGWTQSDLNYQKKESLKLRQQLESTQSSLGLTIKVLVICVSICLIRYFY